MGVEPRALSSGAGGVGERLRCARCERDRGFVRLDPKGRGKLSAAPLFRRREPLASPEMIDACLSIHPSLCSRDRRDIEGTSPRCLSPCSRMMFPWFRSCGLFIRWHLKCPCLGVSFTDIGVAPVNRFRALLTITPFLSGDSSISTRRTPDMIPVDGGFSGQEISRFVRGATGGLENLPRAGWRHPRGSRFPVTKLSV